MAAYVSRLNACQYCPGVHEATAGEFGVEEDLLTRIIGDLDRAEPRGRRLPLRSRDPRSRS